MTSTDEIQLNDPQTLYRRWEDSQWSPFVIDFATDKQQWGAVLVDGCGGAHHNEVLRLGRRSWERGGRDAPGYLRTATVPFSSGEGV